MKCKAKNIVFQRLCFFLLVIVCAANAQAPATILYVTPFSPVASDANPGTAKLPLQTISRAAALAVAANAAGLPSKILIAPGIYRESVLLPHTGKETPAPIVFEAAQAGKSIVSGADVWDGWQASDLSGIYTHAWPYSWGLAPYPEGWTGNVQLSEIVRRREMIFANGELLKQVLFLSEIAPGTFFISEAKRLVYVQLPHVSLIGNTLIEVATRHPLLRIDGKNTVVLKGLVFERANNAVGEGGAVMLNNSTNLRVENCAVRWNSYEGLSAANVSHLAIADSTVNFNGGLGLGAWTISDSSLTGTETSNNNWRGVRGGLTDWDPAGMKLLLARKVTLLRHKASHNSARGLWLDTDDSNVVIEDSVFTENLVDGLFIEAAQGPITIHRSVFSRNGQRGVLLGNAANGTFQDNILYGNSEAQFLVSGTQDGRTVQDHITGAILPAVQTINWNLSGNSIVGRTSKELLIGTTLPEIIWRKYTSTGFSVNNTWFNLTDPFTFEPAGGGRLNLEQWRKLTGLDISSKYANPGFADPEHNVFSRNMDGEKVRR